MRSLAVKHSLFMIDIGIFFVPQEMKYLRVPHSDRGKRARSRKRVARIAKKGRDGLRKLAPRADFLRGVPGKLTVPL